MPELLDYHDALNALLNTHTPVSGEEPVRLGELARRVLSRAVVVQHDVPAFDNSAMDGYAICGNDRRRWDVVQRVAAGDSCKQGLLAGQAARIFTGAPVPPGATAVLMQERVVVEGEGRVIALPADEADPIEEGLNIRRQAEELRQGEVMLPKHLRLTPAAIGLLSAQGYTHVFCLPRLRVTVFSSGNELVEPGESLKTGQIYDSNRHMLVALLQEQGFEVTDGGILPDHFETTRNALVEAARSSHAIVCSGGVSVGEEDHLKAALSDAGELTQWRLFIKPGKPFAWGHIDSCRVFMLPGNPVSSLVTFRQLALPALLRLAGLPVEDARPWAIHAKADFERGKTEARREFVRVNLHAGQHGYQVVPQARQGSAMLTGVAFAQALAEIPPGAVVTRGMDLTVYPLADRF